VDMATLRSKSLRMTDLFRRLVEEQCAGHGLAIATPRDHEMRGSQRALTHWEGYAIMQTPIARGVVGDFRAPDIRRSGLTALSPRDQDLWDAVICLRAIMEGRAWDVAAYRTRAAVTCRSWRWNGCGAPALDQRG